jgi:hypothetical protein
MKEEAMRKRTSLLIVAAALIITATPALFAQTPVSASSLDQILAGWPEKPRQAVTTLVAKYGQPNEATPSMVIWNANGPWKRTIVHRDEIAHHFPKAHTDFVEQFIDYRVPVDKFDDLAAYDGSVIAERTKGEISARCDKEEMNLLALNLAHDIVRGARSVEDARRFYADTAMAAMRGEMHPYTQALQFEVPATRTADLDKAFSPRAMTSSAKESSDDASPNASETRTRMRKD